MKELNEQLKKGEIGGVYLFYGEERYLVRLYTERIRRALMQEDDEMMNLTVLESPKSTEEIVENLETLPFMVERRLLIVKNSGAFQLGEDRTELGNAIAMPNSSAVIIFIEEKVDKRSKMYKQVGKSGKIVEFVQQTPADLVKWIKRETGKKGKTIDDATAGFFINYVGRDMTQVMEELEKVTTFLGERIPISKEDIQAICSVNIEVNVFSMTDCIANKKAASAMKVFSDLISLNEPAQRIFYMIIRQFRQLLRVVVFQKEGKGKYDIAKLLGVPVYPAESMMQQSGRFGEEKIQEILKDLLQMDVSVKNGNLDASDACMLIIMKYAS